MKGVLWALGLVARMALVILALVGVLLLLTAPPPWGAGKGAPPWTVTRR